MSAPLHESNLKSLKLRHRGKVRDIYDIDDQYMLIVTTDRLSAFDVVLADPIPGKGAMLTAMSNFWFARTRRLIANQVADLPLEQVLKDPVERAQVEKQAVVVKKLKALPIEAIVRGYLVGSGWKEYQKSGTVCGLKLPAGLKEADKLPEPIFTPSTKAAAGQHDENISFEQAAGLLGRAMAEKVKQATIAIYKDCAEYALTKGIIIADTSSSSAWTSRARLPSSMKCLPLIPRGSGRRISTSPAPTRRALTSNTCAIGWRRVAGTRKPQRPNCRRK